MKPQLSLYLDTRRPKSGNLYPVKLRVWDALSKRAKLFPTQLDITERDFKGAWVSLKPRKEFSELRVQLETIKAKANEAIKELNPFTFEGLERKLYRRTGDGINIIYHYNQTIQERLKQGQTGTASNYELSLKSIMNFLIDRSGRAPKTISFYEITTAWLNDYERFMVRTGKTLSTVGIYLRPLRAIFNKAIAENELKPEIYPFGKRKYQIPAGRNIKKALTKEQLKKLFELKPKTNEQQKAKDFWFFSYSCNGMNIKDIAQLRYKDIDQGIIKFYRAKTINTGKGNSKPITAHITDFSETVIKKYGNKDKSPDNYVFEILKNGLTPQQQKRAITNFTRFINQHMQNFCEKNNLQLVSTYWARHSFATSAVRSGASMELIQESLGHGNLKTTMSYFAGFEDKTKKELAKKLMEF